jgi:hypothetical protein
MENRMKKLIALGHYSRTGKNAVAEIIQRKLGGPSQCEVLSFAEPLKKHCHEIFAWAGVREAAYYETAEGIAKRNEILPMLGLTPVELWVKFGSTLVRDQIHDETWLMLARERIREAIRKGRWAILTDMRFHVETRMLRDEGGVLVRVLRPNIAPRNTVADINLLDFHNWDFTINNNGTLHDLDSACDWLLTELHRADGSNRLIEAASTTPLNCYELKELIACQ